jgi:hypothetical protein
MLKALSMGFLLFEAALSQTTNLPWSFKAAETQTAEPLQASRSDTPGTIDGVVTDGSGSVVVGALVTLGSTASTGKRTTVTSETGSFHFAAVAPGNYTIAIVADGFAPWIAASVVVREGENPAVTSAVLQVASASTRLDVGLSPKELAVEQLKTEEKQRLFGVFPNYFVTYDPNAAPLNAAQKLQLGWKTILDPTTILSSAITAGIEQARNSYHQFGQGMEGYGKRFGAQYADAVNGVIIGGVIMQTVFHQDPRYFYKGTGSFRSRALYAIATAFVRKGDNGHWQPDYSDVLGGLAAGEISTLYYPASSRTGLRLFHDVLFGLGGSAASNLFEEFLSRKITTHVPKAAMAGSKPILREGTPVSLISVEELGSKTAEGAGPIDFVLANDVLVGGVLVTKAGSKAGGQVRYASGPNAGGEATHVELERVRLKVGSAEVPLRSTPLRKGGAALVYHRLEDSERIAIVLYVAQNTALPSAQ